MLVLWVFVFFFYLQVWLTVGLSLEVASPTGGLGWGELALFLWMVVALTELPPRAHLFSLGPAVQGLGGSQCWLLPAAVTGHCGYVLFNATHSHSPLPEEGWWGEGSMRFSLCGTIPEAHDLGHKCQLKKLG